MKEKKLRTILRITRYALLAIFIALGIIELYILLFCGIGAPSI